MQNKSFLKKDKALMCKFLNGTYCYFIKDQNRNKKIRISFVCSSHVTGKDNVKDFFCTYCDDIMKVK